MKKKLLVSLWLILCLMFVGCGSSDGGKTGKDEQNGSESAVVENETETKTEEAKIDFTGVVVGGDLTFGHNGSDPIVWRVLAIEDGKALIITKDCLMKRSYGGKTVVTWETCSLREYLNGDFYNNFFSNAEKSKIVPTTVVNDDNPKYGTDGGNNTEDKVFLLSIDEAKTYFDSDESRVASFAGKNIDWWLRSSGYNENRAACVYYNGYVNVSGGTFIDGNGLRPVCWVNIK